MEIQKLEFPQVHPYIRYVQELKIYSGDYPNLIKSLDCRLFYVNKNSGSLFLENMILPIEQGDLVFWQPGTPYRIDPQSDNPIHLLGVNFDLTQTNRHLDNPIPPVISTAFNENMILSRYHLIDEPSFNVPVYLPKMQNVEDTLWEMKREFQIKKIHYQERLGGLMQSILSLIARRLGSSPMNSSVGSASDSLIDLIIDYIHTHYAEDISNESMGSHFNYHPNYINRQMVLFTNKSLYQYLLAYRITKAIELLETTNLPISEVGQIVGFKDFSHFSKFFKRKTGNSPSAFRRVRA